MKESKIARLNRPHGRRNLLLLALAVTLFWSAALLVGGCTSDPANLVGAALIDSRIDTTLALVEITAVEAFSGIKVSDANEKITESQTLYLGTEKNTKASFIVNFDFTDIFTDEYPEEIFTEENIKTVKLSLTKLVPYKAIYDSILIDPDTGDTTTVHVSTGQPLDLIYFVHELDEAFDPLDFENFPASVPPFNSAIINQDFQIPNTSSEVFLNLYVSDFLRWVNGRTKIGLLFRLGDQSDPGLVGYASNELTTFSEVPLLAVGTIVAPDLIVDFADQDINLQVPPAEDTTVFEEVDTVPQTAPAAADTFVLRTGLRSYPAIRFDLANLPTNALINRAVLSVTNDTSSSYGPEFSVMISEIVGDVMDDPSYSLDVSTVLDSTRVYPLSFRSNLRAKEDFVIEFDITTGIRRAVNRVNEEPRGFLLSGVEDKFVFPFGNLPPDLTQPGFYYRQLNLLGLNDPDPQHRPHLKIWYSVINDLSGGGQ